MPELRKIVLTHRTFDIVGPTSAASIALANMLDKTERFYGVTFMQDGSPVDVAYRVIDDANGNPSRLVFDAPAGLTQACVMFTSGKTSYNEDYINMVDRASVAQLIDAVYEPHFEHLGDEFGKTILGFFSDEPGFANEKGTTGPDGISDTLIGKATAPLPWSVELERRLRAALGERYLAELPHLWDREPAGAHVRHVYMDIASTLYKECFCDQLGDWCRARGVQYIGHVIEDKDCHARLGVGAGHYFRAVGGQDMAGVDIVINQLVPGMDRGLHGYGRGVWDLEFYNYVLPKLGSSAAHLDPKKQGRCMAEVFGAFGWHEGLREMKWIADHFLVRGVNWFVPHAFSMAAFPDWDCPPHFYAHGQNPQFAHFGQLMSYMNRTASLLSGGRTTTPVALLYHADAEWAGEANLMQHAASELMRAQIDFDIVPAEAFEDAGRYAVEIAADGADGSGFSVNGQAYRCLVMPGAEFVGGAVLDFAARAAAAGVAMYALDELPNKRYDGDTADREGFASLDATALAGIKLLAPTELAATLANTGMQTVVCAEPQPWLRTLRYERAGESYLMLVNEHPKQGISTQIALARASTCSTAPSPPPLTARSSWLPTRAASWSLGLQVPPARQPLETKPHASTGPGRLPSLPLAPMPLANLLSLQTCTTFPRPNSPARPARSATRPPLFWAKQPAALPSTLGRSLRPQPSPSTANPSAPASVRLTALRPPRFWPASTRLRSTSSTPSTTPSPTCSA